MATTFALRATRLAAAAALLLTAAACDRSPTGGDHPDAAAVRLTVGAQAVTVNAAGAQTGGLTLAQGTHTVVVTWLDASMNAITSFEAGVALEISAATGAGVAFTPNGLFGGTLNATSAGTKTLNVRLMHQGHPDFAQNVTVTIQ